MSSQASGLHELAGVISGPLTALMVLKDQPGEIINIKSYRIKGC